MVTGTAMRLKSELASLIQKHGITAPPFTPPPLLPPVDHDVIVEGYASPTTVDRERMKFAPRCWRPFTPTIPLLHKHQADQVAGKILELKATDQGLFVRALVSHAEAKRCSGFSVTATVHDYIITNPEDRDRVTGLITDASLVEVTLATHMANPAAVVTKRYRPGPLDNYMIKLRDLSAARLRTYDLQREAVNKAAEIVRAMITTAQRSDGCAAPGATSGEVHSQNAPEAGFIYGKIPARPMRKTEFKSLIEQL